MSRTRVLSEYETSTRLKLYIKTESFRVLVEQYATEQEILTLEMYFEKESLMVHKKTFDFQGVKACDENPYDEFEHVEVRFLDWK